MNEREVSELVLKVIALRDKRVKYSKLKEVFCQNALTNKKNDLEADLFEFGIWYGHDDIIIQKNLVQLNEDITEDVWQLIYWLEHTV